MLHSNADKRPSVNKILRNHFIKHHIQLFLEESSKNRRRTSSKTSTSSNRPDSSKSTQSSSKDANKINQITKEPIKSSSTSNTPNTHRRLTNQIKSSSNTPDVHRRYSNQVKSSVSNSNSPNVQRRASDIVKSSHRSSKSNTPDLQRRAFDNVKSNVGKPPRVVKENVNFIPQKEKPQKQSENSETKPNKSEKNENNNNNVKVEKISRPLPSVSKNIPRYNDAKNPTRQRYSDSYSPISEVRKEPRKLPTNYNNNNVKHVENPSSNNVVASHHRNDVRIVKSEKIKSKDPHLNSSGESLASNFSSVSTASKRSAARERRRQKQRNRMSSYSNDNKNNEIVRPISNGSGDNIKTSENKKISSDLKKVSPDSVFNNGDNNYNKKERKNSNVSPVSSEDNKKESEFFSLLSSTLKLEKGNSP